MTPQEKPKEIETYFARTVVEDPHNHIDWLMDRVKTLESALSIYASHTFDWGYDHSGDSCDYGIAARKALEGKE